MNRSNLDVTSLVRSDDYAVLVDAINDQYNKVDWRAVATRMPISRDRKFTAFVKETGIHVMAAVLNFDSDKPLRSARGIEAYSGNIPKLGHAGRIDEQDILDKLSMQAVGSAIAPNDARDLLWVTNDSLIGGVHNTTTNFCWQLLSTGKIMTPSGSVNTDIDGTPANGIVFDGRVPAANMRTVGKVWSDPTADPIQDLLNAQKYAKQAKPGIPFNAWGMDSDKYDQFMQHDNVIKKVVSRMTASGSITPTESEIKNILYKTFGIAPIVKIDSVSAIEVDGIETYIKGWEENNVSLFNLNPKFINLHNAISAHDPKIVGSVAGGSNALRASTEDGMIVSVSAWDELKVENTVMVESWQLPALADPRKLVIVQTNKTA